MRVNPVAVLPLLVLDRAVGISGLLDAMAYINGGPLLGYCSTTYDNHPPPLLLSQCILLR